MVEGVKWREIQISHFWKQQSEVNSTYIKTPSLPQACKGTTQFSPVLLSKNVGGCVVPFESDHYVTTADISMFTQLEEAPSPRGQAFCSSRWLYYSLSVSTRHSRFYFWTGFKGSLPGREPSAVSGAAVTSWPTQPQSPFTEGASALPCDRTK